MRVHLSNLGCKLNQAETDGFARSFLARGHQVVGVLEEAEVHVVNSCTVTHLAARDSRKAARRAGRVGDGVRTVLTGCYATAAGDEARALAGVDLVVANGDKERLVDLIEAQFGGLGWSDRPPVSYVPLEFGPTRALLKVEDGCNMACSFCIIPATRGRQVSRPIATLIDEARLLEESGYREIVVTGVQISAFRDGAARLPQLLEALLEATRVCRFRLTSIAPWDFSPELLDLFPSDRVCRHVHLSLQSGSSGVLERMRRPYSADAFGRLVEECRRRVPGIAVTTDVIVGFPGETDAEFAESLAFVDAMSFAKVHAFGYSPRPGTAAADLPDPVDPRVRKVRMRQMLEVGGRSELAFRSSQWGSVGTALWEERRQGRWRGMTDNYVRVFSDSERDLRGLVTPVRLQRPTADGVVVDLAA